MSRISQELKELSSGTWLEAYSVLCKKFLLPYQLKWITDEKRFKAAIKARQTGFSFANAWEAVQSVEADGCDQLIISASERQAQEVLDKCMKIEKLFSILPRSKGGPPAKVVGSSKSDIRFDNGSKILSLPQSPETIRGFSGNIFLDEQAHYRDDVAIWKAIFPTITRGFKLRMCSTPLGQSGKFWEVWTGGRDYSRHSVDIYTAVSQGLRVDIEEIRRNTDDETFRQEYLCEFIDETTSFIPYALIRRSIGESCSGGTHYLGVDVGRKHDRTSIFVVGLLNGTVYWRHLESLRNKTYGDQRKIIERIIVEYGVQRGCIDSTGLGNQLAEEIHKTYPFIEPVWFTADVKERIAVSVKRRMEDGTLVIPDDRDLISDIHSIKKTVTASNNIRFDAEATDKGHADRFWALALATEAAVRMRPIIRIF